MYDLVKQQVDQRNREIATEAVVEAALGVLFSFLVFGFVFVASWVACFLVVGYSRAVPTASLIVLVYALVALYSAWRRVNPLENLTPLTPGEEAAAEILQATGHGAFAPHFTRHSLAGFGTVLIGGPANILQSIATWRHRMPHSSAILTDAAGLLERAGEGVDLEQAGNPQAAFLLHRLGLVKVIGTYRGPGRRIVLTTRGEELVHAGSK